MGVYVPKNRVSLNAPKFKAQELNFHHDGIVGADGDIVWCQGSSPSRLRCLPRVAVFW